VTLVYAYGIVLPVLLWIALRYMGVGEWSIVEAIAVWGYAMFVWIPVSVRIRFLCVLGSISLTCVITDTVRHTCANRTLGSRRCSLCVVRLLPDSECISHPRICMLSLLIFLP
jgi:hypothetical protein